MLCLFALLGAQTDSQALSEARLQVAQNPVDTGLRMTLAYHLMLSNKPKEALTHYQVVMAQDSLNSSAAAGILWAHNSLQDWKSTRKEAKALARQFPQEALIWSYKAFAESQTMSLHQARNSYTKAIRKSDDPLVKGYAHQGLGWAYLNLGDYPKAKTSFQKAETYGLQDSLATGTLSKLNTSISLGASLDFDDKQVFNATLGLSKGNYRLGLGMEEIRLKKEHLRRAWWASLQRQGNIADIRAFYSALQGKSEEIYPAHITGLDLGKKLYWKDIRFTGGLGQKLGLYPNFNTYQSDLALSLSQDSFTLGGNLSYLYRDNDSPGSDSQGLMQHYYLFYKQLKPLELSAYLSLGDGAWWISPYGIVNDTFEAEDRILGASAKYPINKHIDLMVYYQRGYTDDESKELGSLSLSYTF